MIEDELPNRIAKNYFYFKNTAIYFYQKNQFVDALKLYCWYGLLKICNLFLKSRN